MRAGTVRLFTESGDGIGYGHLARMKVIASELERRGAVCVKVTDHRGDRANALLDGWSVSPWLDGGIPLADATANGAGAGAAATVIDSYLAGADTYREAASLGCPVLAIDDFHRIDYPADWIVNPNPYFAAAKDDRWRGGAAYVLLREEIRNGAERRPTGEAVERVAITPGGTDPHRILPTLLEMLRDWPGELEVLAGTEERRRELAGAFPACGRTFHGALSAGEVRSCFLGCDLVVSGCGQTLHELAFLGVPAVGIRVGEDQIPNQAFYLGRGFLGEEIDASDPSWGEGFRREWQRAASSEERGARVDSVAGLIDGRGGERLVDLILRSPGSDANETAH